MAKLTLWTVEDSDSVVTDLHQIFCCGGVIRWLDGDTIKDILVYETELDHDV